MKILYPLIIVMMTPVLVAAETIILESGKTIEGEVIEKTDAYVRMDDGQQVWKVRFNMMTPESAAPLKTLPEKTPSQKESSESTGVVTGRMEMISEDPLTYITTFYDGHKEIASRTERLSLRNFQQTLNTTAQNPGHNYANVTNIIANMPKPELIAAQGKIPDGPVTVYGPNQLFIKQTFQDGQLHGEVLTSQSDGQILREERYRNGKRHGRHRLYDARLETFWDMGILTKAIIYNEQGQIEGEMEFQDGQPAHIVQYDSQGNIRQEWRPR